MVSDFFRFLQRRDVYGAWEQYLGLEHTDTAPKRAYTANQVCSCFAGKYYLANFGCQVLPLVMLGLYAAAMLCSLIVCVSELPLLLKDSVQALHFYQTVPFLNFHSCLGIDMLPEPYTV